MEDSTILVSICCITFNHAAFIAETLAGFEAQEVDFPVEVIIHDDFSTDGTRELLLAYKQHSKYPVTLLFPDENRYSKGERIFLKTFFEAKGTYIATCEGDDYWLHPTKLQEQVDFLEGNNEYRLISGSARQYFQATHTFAEVREMDAYTFTYKDLIVRNQSATCATLFRNNIDANYTIVAGMGTDSQYWIKALGKSEKGFHTGKIEAVYRRHENSLTANTNKARSDYDNIIQACRRKIEKARFWNAYFDNEAKKEVLQVEHKFRKRMLSLSLKRRKIWDIPTFALQYLFVKLKKMIA